MTKTKRINGNKSPEEVNASRWWKKRKKFQERARRKVWRKPVLIIRLPYPNIDQQLDLDCCGKDEVLFAFIQVCWLRWVGWFFRSGLGTECLGYWTPWVLVPWVLILWSGGVVIESISACNERYNLENWNKYWNAFRRLIIGFIDDSI